MSFDHLERTKKILEERGFKIVGEKPIQDGEGCRVDIEGGGAINIFKTGVYNFEGIPTDRLKILFGSAPGAKP